MDVIKELCAYLPNQNPRGVWGQFGMREYLSINVWQQSAMSVDEDGEFVDFTLITKDIDMPGSFKVRTNYTVDKVTGIYWEPSMTFKSQEHAKKASLLFDLTFTPNMHTHMMGGPIDHPDAGTW